MSQPNEPIDAEIVADEVAGAPQEEVSLENARLTVRGLAGVAFVGGLGPLVVVWDALVGAAQTVIAELLEHTDGLEPGTFHQGFRIAFTLVGLVVLTTVWRALRRVLTGEGPSPRAPLDAVLIGCLFVGAPAVGLDLFLFDVPDSLTAAVLLGCVFMSIVVLPVVLVVLWYMTTAALVRSVVTHEAAHRAITLAVGLALGGGALTTAGVVGASTGYLEATDTSVVPASSWLRAGALGALSESQLRHRLVAESDALVANDAHVFAACIKELAQGEEPTELEQGIARLSKRWLSPEDARDAAYGTLLKVCEKHTRERVRELRPYYARAIKNEALRMRSSRCRFLPSDVDGYPSSRNGCGIDEARRVRRALGSLSPDEQLVVVRHHVEGHTHAELAKELGISNAASRKRLQRATEALRKAYADRAY